ncbi:MAG: aspartate kinase, monofunctional class [Crenarchaeota archaeon 13_1_40CM_2_52_14]|nr:MAG: aspartate kinase, monofunctional class [Crenarchaeota archaeon 13_1_40CM_3_52_17]OLD35043.1 MAG: aspartate kinase, monofunctional class [Crenarchaeota archaeon 13_1_40CM_2_52_14]
MKLVMKFGGTSLANAPRMKNAARIILRYSPKNKIVVVASAVGETTDQLIQIAELAKKGNLQQARKLLSKIQASHLKIARMVAGRGETRELVSRLDQLNSELEQTVEGIAHLRELTSRSRDYLLSFGERLSTPILAATMSAMGLRSRALTGAEAGITTDDNFGEAKPLTEISYHQVHQRLDPLWGRRIIPVVTGFIAATVDGSITTLGRGGSDYTATLLAAALGADEIWIWTDVDGLMTADPRIVKNAIPLPYISFGEALELSYFGAKMMHPRALQPAGQKKIPVRIKNSSRPARSGTLVSASESSNGGKVVKAVSIIRDVGIVTVSGSGMMGAPGVAAKVFQTLGSNNVNVMMISQGSSEATISSVVANREVDRAVRALQLALMGQGYVDRIVAEKDACIIAVVGSGMKGTPGVAARIFTAVAKRKLNVRMVAQGSSEYNVSFVVSHKDGPEAVRAIHEEFNLGR